MVRPTGDRCPSCGSQNRNEVFLKGESVPIGLLCIGCGYTEPWNGTPEPAPLLPRPKGHPLVRARKRLEDRTFKSSQAQDIAEVVETVIDWLLEREQAE